MLMQLEGFFEYYGKVFLMKKFIIFTVDIQILRESRSNVKYPYGRYVCNSKCCICSIEFRIWSWIKMHFKPYLIIFAEKYSGLGVYRPENIFKFKLQTYHWAKNYTSAYVWPAPFTCCGVIQGNSCILKYRHDFYHTKMTFIACQNCLEKIKK